MNSDALHHLLGLELAGFYLRPPPRWRVGWFPVEAALTGGLQEVAGIAVSMALPTAIIYRLVTFYGRAPSASA